MCAVLVVLDERTWTSGEDTAKLVDHIHIAMRLGVHVNCVHERPAVVGPPRCAGEANRARRSAKVCCRMLCESDGTWSLPKTARAMPAETAATSADGTPAGGGWFETRAVRAWRTLCVLDTV